MAKFILTPSFNNNNASVDKQGAWIKIESELPYQIGYDINGNKTNKVRIILVPSFEDGRYLLHNAYPIENNQQTGGI